MGRPRSEWLNLFERHSRLVQQLLRRLRFSGPFVLGDGVYSFFLEESGGRRSAQILHAPKKILNTHPPTHTTQHNTTQHNTTQHTRTGEVVLAQSGHKKKPPLPHPTLPPKEQVQVLFDSLVDFCADRPLLFQIHSSNRICGCGRPNFGGSEFSTALRA